MMFARRLDSEGTESPPQMDVDTKPTKHARGASGAGESVDLDEGGISG